MTDPKTILALRLLARLDPTEGQAATLRRLTDDRGGSDLDWPGLARLAAAGGVAGLVARSVERLELPAPRPVARELAMARLATEMRNRELMSVTAELCGEAANRGLTLVPFKGAALLMDRPYPALDLRDLCDVDLVGRRADYAALERLLVDAGLTAHEARERELRHEHHVRYYRTVPPARAGGVGAGRVMVELHWTPFYTLYSNPVADEAALGPRRLVRHRFAGGDYRLLDAEDTVLSLLLHLAMHRYRGQLKWAVDVDEAVACFEQQAEGFDWAELHARAASLGALRAVGFGLHACAAALGQLPTDPRPARDLRWRLLRRLTPTEGLVCRLPQPEGWRRALTDLALVDGTVAGLRNLLFKAGEIHERGNRHLPSWLVRRGLDR